MFNPSRVSRNAVLTHEGGAGRKASAKEELTLAVLGTFLQDSFYEKSNLTARRIYGLAQKVDKEYLEKLAVVARQDFNMRTTPAFLLGAYTLLHGQPSESAMKKVVLRGDELGDYLGSVAYFADNRKVTPAAVRAARKVLQSSLTERAALRYADSNRKWSLAKIIRLTHARAGASAAQKALFNFVLEHHRTGSMTQAWDATGLYERSFLPLVAKAVAGEDEGIVSWERTRSSGASWNAVYKDMGYMALLRNLRNFMQDPTFTGLEEVCQRLSSRDEVAKSKQLPFRFLSAINAVRSESGGRHYHDVLGALYDALDHSIGNLPPLEGRTLVVTDTSGSMDSKVSGHSDIRAIDIGALFGAALSTSGNTDLIAFGSYAERITVSPVESVYSVYSKVVDDAGRNRRGYSTELGPVFRMVDASSYDNIILLSDMQLADDSRVYLKNFRGNLFGVNLVPYEAQIHKNQGNFYSIGGWSDATVKLISTLSSGEDIVTYVERWNK